MVVREQFARRSAGAAHTGSCPARRAAPALRRAERPGAVRLGFVPEEWFLFFHAKTGVSGPYLFALVVANYLFSKELYVMEHEYYGGLSIALLAWGATERLGPQLGAALDRALDEGAAAREAERAAAAGTLRDVIAAARAAQRSAEAQALLMAAKKENVALQLEAAYRERCARLHGSVVARLAYQVRRSRVQARVQQRCMLQWVLQRVRQAVTPDFEKAFLGRAIEDVAALASRAAK